MPDLQDMDFENDIPSSPPARAAGSSYTPLPMSPPSRPSRQKERRNPSVTPRRFGRFFTPRSSMSIGGRDILGSLSSRDINGRSSTPPPPTDDLISSDPITSSPSDRWGHQARHLTNKRKHVAESDDSQETAPRRRDDARVDFVLPPLNYSSRRSTPVYGGISERHDSGLLGSNDILPTPLSEGTEERPKTLGKFFKASRQRLSDNINKHPRQLMPAVVQSTPGGCLTPLGYQPTPTRKFQSRGFESQLLNREHGYGSHPGQHHLSVPSPRHQTTTANFYSHANDYSHLHSIDNGGFTVPFSLSSSHTSDLTAAGDEQGWIRFFNTAGSRSTKSDYSLDNLESSFKAHDNAIMDLDWSKDDLRLATACGDRTGKIIDTLTQQTAVELGGHLESLRQVSFQQGSASSDILATSDRSGRVQIWDLRCAALPVNTFSGVISSDSAPGISSRRRLQRRNQDVPVQSPEAVNVIDNAHERKTFGYASPASITSLQWMTSGREHLLFTSSEANAVVKLWDTRYIKPRKQVEEVPLAMTQEPSGHGFRPYGITSLALNTDASRLYAVCKDSTVYAYSTNHMLLGIAPELSACASKRRPRGAGGLGPLFGFKHDLLSVSSFYVKCSVRKPGIHGNSSELLAVGSSKSCAVLFPLDEGYPFHQQHQQQQQPRLPGKPSADATALPTPSPFSAGGYRALNSSPAPASLGGTATSTSTTPILHTGTALIKAHTREVTNVSWTHTGSLVTASDDQSIRHWQENQFAASHLRTVGEFGGERHMCGWADVDSSWWDVDD